MSYIVLFIGILFLLTCNPLGVIWGGIMILLSLPVCIVSILDFITSCVFTWQGMIILLVVCIILYIIGSTGGQHE